MKKQTLRLILSVQYFVPFSNEKEIKHVQKEEIAKSMGKELLGLDISQQE